MPSALGLPRLADDLAGLADVDDATAHALGQAGKAAALEVVADDLGADRMFSGFRRRVRLSAGYDVGDPVILNLRPEGLWMLADRGRRRSGSIRPRRARRRAQRAPRGLPAVGTPGRYVKVGRFRPSQGLNTIDDTVDLIDQRLPDAYSDHLKTRIGDMS